MDLTNPVIILEFKYQNNLTINVGGIVFNFIEGNTYKIKQDNRLGFSDWGILTGTFEDIKGEFEYAVSVSPEEIESIRIQLLEENLN